MLARLGTILYSLGCILSALVIVFGYRFGFVDLFSTRPSAFLNFAGVVIIAGVVWMIGHTSWYVLSEK
jgi:hypothetical protein